MRDEMTHVEEKPAWQSSVGIAVAESVPVEDEEVVRSEKKKEKKRRKKELKRRQALLERFSLPTVPTPPGKSPTAATAPELPTDAPVTPVAPSSRRAATWLRRATRGLAANEMILAHKSSMLIAVNCLMLSFSAFSVHRSMDQGRLWWAFIPLALTNVLSLVFALRSAQVADGQSTLSELTSMPQEDYQSALVSLVNDKERVVSTTAHETYILRGDLSRRQRHLRTSINVLTGGLPLSVLMFAFCFAMSSR